MCAATTIDDEALTAAARVLEICRRAGTMVATAESCTGGLVAASLTSVAGSSSVVDRGFVTYSNDAKTEMLGVDRTLIASHGAVSQEVAAAMAEGALDRSRAGLTISITGVAGPGGGTTEKPVGLVWFGAGRSGFPVTTERFVFSGDRSDIRSAATLYALQLLERTAAST
ncbi:nicotinamide-nucleotide amidohydrolase family protein [Fodinicurvata sp. EGI_FJ10296]|uniref:CinA family protein n=1 Tax=Fodinicurvata sp. EGI_FJ10296 TaxID=3231908 RepID=UPI003453EB9A